MTLIEHLYELRNRLTIAAAALVVTSIIGWIWWATRIGGLPTLADLIMRPYCDLPAIVRGLDKPGDCRLLATQVGEAFAVRFQVSVAVGFILAAPVWLTQLWGFVTPGLYAKERKFGRTFVIIAAILFVLGGVMAYYVVPEGIAFLVDFGALEFNTALSGREYVSFILLMLLIFGVSFELPLLVVMLNRVGILSYAKLKKTRRGAIFGLFVFAAIATPGQDPVSMLVLAGALAVFYEISIQISRINDRKKSKAEALENWDDYEAAPLDHEPEPVESSALPESEPTPPAKAGEQQPRVRYDDAT